MTWVYWHGVYSHHQLHRTQWTCYGQSTGIVTRLIAIVVETGSLKCTCVPNRSLFLDLWHVVLTPLEYVLVGCFLLTFIFSWIVSHHIFPQQGILTI